MDGVRGPAGVLPFGIRVCGIREIRATVAAFRPTHVIAISDPGQDGVPVPDDALVLRLAFWDLDREPGVGDPMLAALSRRGSVRVPQVGDIQAILEFGRGIPVGGRLLCCCGAGRSRSAAVAAIVVAQAMPGHEERAGELIGQIRPEACPNRRMLQIADELLGAGGRLTASTAGIGPMRGDG